MVYRSKSEEETFQIGFDFSKKILSKTVCLVNGILGAGKSVFIRGVLRGLGVEEGIPSPTFAIVNEYHAKFVIYHFDLYRISDPFELYEIGFEEYINGEGVSFIEWASNGGDLIPEDAINITISVTEYGREITIDDK